MLPFRWLRLLKVWIAATALLLPPTLPAAEALPTGLAELSLSDQFGGTDTLAAHRGSPILVVVVAVQRLSMIERWERTLRERFPNLAFFNVADMPADGPVDPTRAAATLRKRVPAGVAVLMDLDRRWASTLKLDTGLPNLLLVDGSGRLVGQWRGRYGEALAAEVMAAVEPVVMATGAAP